MPAGRQNRRSDRAYFSFPFSASPYFNLTKSKTKIAHTPTVTGNCTTAASRIPPPLGRAYVSTIIARAVSTPTTRCLFQVVGVCPHFPLLLGPILLAGREYPPRRQPEQGCNRS